MERNLCCTTVPLTRVNSSLGPRFQHLHLGLDTKSITEMVSTLIIPPSTATSLYSLLPGSAEEAADMSSPGILPSKNIDHSLSLQLHFDSFRRSFPCNLPSHNPWNCHLPHDTYLHRFKISHCLLFVSSFIPIQLDGTKCTIQGASHDTKFLYVTRSGKINRLESKLWLFERCFYTASRIKQNNIMQFEAFSSITSTQKC